jgi:uncharacterized protein YndB with AHSA1/START domain
MEHVEREVTVQKPPDDVWQAVIDSERLGTWLGGELDLTLRPGARGSFLSPGEMPRRVLVLGVDDQHELSFRWWPETDAGAASTVTITVDAAGDDGPSCAFVNARAMLATA